MNKSLLSFMSVVCSLFLIACDAPTQGNLSGFPEPPNWLDVQLSFDNLPGPDNSSFLVYDITVTDEDSVMTVTNTGDTL